MDRSSARDLHALLSQGMVWLAGNEISQCEGRAGGDQPAVLSKEVLSRAVVPRAVVPGGVSSGVGESRAVRSTTVPPTHRSVQREALLEEIRAAQRAGLHRREMQVVPFGAAEIDTALGYGGLWGGALHEWAFHPSSSDDLSVARHPRSQQPSESHAPLAILSVVAGNALRAISHRNSSARYVIWIGRACWPTPYLLAQTVGAIERCLFLDPPDQRAKLWALDVALRSPATAVVIADQRAPTHGIGLALSRRYALAARAGGVLGLLLCHEQAFHHTSMAMSRWLVTPHPTSEGDPRFALSLVRYKGPTQTPLHWSVELGATYDQEHSPLCVRVLSRMGDNRDQAESRVHPPPSTTARRIAS